MLEVSDEIKNITRALLIFQGSVSAVKKDGLNPHFKSRYASLESVMNTAKPILNANGVLLTQAPGCVVDGAVSIVTRLTHESGEFMQSTLHVPLGKRDPQGVGSAITYGLRYSLMSILGLPPTDDDGQSAQTSLKDVIDALSVELRECESIDDLERCRALWRNNAKSGGLQREWMGSISAKFSARELEIKGVKQ